MKDDLRWLEDLAESVRESEMCLSPRAINLLCEEGADDRLMRIVERLRRVEEVPS